MQASGDIAGPRPQRWYRPAGILSVAACVYLAGIGSYPLLDPDEGRYAEVAREMLQSGDFITPRLNYVKYFEKPPLYYWVTAAALAACGEREWVVRSVAVACGLLTVCVVYLLGRRMFGDRVGLMSSWVYLTSLLPLVMAKLPIIDGMFSLLLACTWGAAWLGLTAGRRRWYLAAWLALGLAVLCKGPVAVALTGLVCGGFVVATRRWRAARGLLWWPGPLLFLLVSVPWHLAVGQRNPEFWHFYFVVQHFGRLGGGEHAKPLWFFVAVLPVCMGLWGIPLFGALARAVRVPGRLLRAGVPAEASHRVPGSAAHRSPEAVATGRVPTRRGGRAPGLSPRGGARPGAGPGGAPAASEAHPAPARAEEAGAVLFLLIWIVAVVGLFSLSRCKLVPYILPAFPALAILVGRHMLGADRTPSAGRASGAPPETGGRSEARTVPPAGGPRPLPPATARLYAWLAAALLLLMIPVLAAAARHNRYVPLDGPLWLMQVALLFGAGLALIAAVYRRYLPLAQGLCLLLLLPGLLQAVSLTAAYRRTPVLMQQMPRPLPDEVRIAELRTYDHSLGFYNRRRIIMVDNLGELAFGAMQEPNPEFFVTDEGKLTDMAAGGPLLVNLRPQDWPGVRGWGCLHLVAANSRNVLVANEAFLALSGLAAQPPRDITPPLLLLPRRATPRAPAAGPEGSGP